MKMTLITLKNLFTAPATLDYPATPRTYPPATRGQVLLTIPKCTLCKICEVKCPTGAILVDRPGKSWTIHRMKCITCGACADACPRDCLTLENHQTPPGTTKQIDILHVPYDPPPKKPKPEPPPP
ncbi:MAG TPA: 4Fe-4S dicluster domain-containing protein, partial [Kiritimatiellia bacterium]|nr:4Fe-4S dicluster domain-containing protein [Kiritimatiellia bacterium]